LRRWLGLRTSVAESLGALQAAVGRGPGCRSRTSQRALRAPALDEVDEPAHRHPGFEGVTEPFVTAHDVVVASAHPQAGDEARLVEVTDDL
jgi:hypothetical protein